MRRLPNRLQLRKLSRRRHRSPVAPSQGRFWQRLDESLSRARSLVLSTVVVAAAVMLLFEIWRGFRYDAVIIEPPSMPEAAAKSGWTGDLFARELGDAVLEIQREAETSVPLQQIWLEEEELEIFLPGQPISVQALVVAIRNLADRPPRRLVAAVVELDEHHTNSECAAVPADLSTPRYLLRARITPAVAAWSVCGATLGDLARLGAERLILGISPYVLASYMYDRDPDRAREITERILRDGPAQQRPWALILQGLLLADTGDYNGAIAKYEEAVRLELDSDAAYYNWALALANLGRHEEAITKFEEAVRLKSDYSSAHVGWGVALGRLGRYEQATTKYEEAVRLKPDDALAHYNWGIALHKLGRYEEAITKYEDAVRLKPDDADAHNNWGVALTALGRHEEAQEKYDKSRALRSQ